MSEARQVHAAPGARLEQQLRDRPWSVDWFLALRWIEARRSDLPRLGHGIRPEEEPVRVSHPPSLRFAPAALAGFARDRAGRPRIAQLAFGLFGPNGPLPLHLTEYVRSLRELERDEALQAFLDIFQHRASMLFYRAWSSVQSTNSLDRPGDDRFSDYVGSLAGYGEKVSSGHDAIPDHARRHVAGHLVRATRNPEGMAAILGAYFGAPFRVEEWVMNWLALSPEDRSTLGGHTDASRLGVGSVCGTAVPDRLHRFRLHAGPLDLQAYRRFLPDGAWYVPVRDWVRHYTGFELAWDLRLVLRGDQVPPARLGAQTQLGWTSWMGGNPGGADRGDLVLDCEAAAAGPRQDSPTSGSS
ncbi:type VI secretion system baseplate subunit TssG [Thauera sp. AutoDN2]|jgi:type VI secretion system protein ImpH|uniref:type VI secretion system baseplate subunit TssG n=1 Tax=unclassified Thauera TaxID=2609274 RepID=UPI002A4549A9|nr:type VI secretion system baseplate subunit TssG [Lentisphaeria bacterium]